MLLFVQSWLRGEPQISEECKKVNVKLSLCLTKYHAMKTYLLLSYAPCHEDVLEEWRYSSAHY